MEIISPYIRFSPYQCYAEYLVEGAVYSHHTLKVLLFTFISSCSVYILLNERKKPNRFLQFFVMTIFVFSYGPCRESDRAARKASPKAACHAAFAV